MRINFALAMAILVMVSISVIARGAVQDTVLSQEQNPPRVVNTWFEKIQLRGYAQLRYNGLFETNPDLKCDQCDKSWGGDNGGFFFRRIRLIFYGQIHPQVYFYIQPDFASGGGNFAQIRDAYFDLAFDKKQEFRVRIGQSKVPFGFENLQSSSNRLPLDRNDGLNSAVPNERETGLFFYYAPQKIRERFRFLTSSGLKGSGDYGMFGLGIYNGQGPNQQDKNRNVHVVSRFTYPFEFSSGQILEASFQGYVGNYIVTRNNPASTDQVEFKDFRYGPTVVLYPQPFGLQAEFNWGKGPEYDPELDDVLESPLQGGYILANYRILKGKDVIIPFTRYHYYKGGKKFEIDATRHRVKELEVGFEWQPHRNFELVCMYTFSDRTAENSLNPSNRQKGSLLRLQAQVNF
ncbi:OprO/OprP family phosphate-selective porin [Algoriphagus limi]|uniref:OprO/OprP family phosphate-selective porin n=1 Tax=Algoriphagus limi TaxID=2975273 RepID=A0ABT2G576_9BACT|nr:OprO/OprP family phosphate-selective porin [Algoriphagus limi]MCS5490421.1 OprO/OprP family phosphate-selective porin [Algoriphagus limi]